MLFTPTVHKLFTQMSYKLLISLLFLLQWNGCLFSGRIGGAFGGKGNPDFKFVHGRILIFSLPPAGVFIMEGGAGAVESNSPVGDVSLAMTLGNGL